MLSSQTPCEKPVESWLNICSVGWQRFDTLRYHSKDDANLWYSASRLPTCVCLPFSFHVVFLIQTHSERRPTRASVPTFILAEFNYGFPFCLSSPRSHSSETLKPLLSFFITLSPYHKSELVFIHTMLCARGGRGGQISVTSITGLFITWLAPRTQCLEESDAAAPWIFSVYNMFAPPLTHTLYLLCVLSSRGTFILACTLSDHGRAKIETAIQADNKKASFVLILFLYFQSVCTLLSMHRLHFRVL